MFCSGFRAGDTLSFHFINFHDVGVSTEEPDENLKGFPPNLLSTFQALCLSFSRRDGTPPMRSALPSDGNSGQTFARWNAMSKLKSALPNDGNFGKTFSNGGMPIPD
jgi:hypothetical protein